MNETGVRENESRDEGSRASARRDRLSFLEPEADASAKEFGDASVLRLVPAQARLEVGFTRALVLKQAVERQCGSGHRYDDRGVVRQPVIRRSRKPHGSNRGSR